MSRLGRGLAASVLIARRRAMADLAPLVAMALLVALATLLSVLAPGVMLDTLDSGARDAVERAGTDADLVAEFTVGEAVAGGQSATPEGAISLADGLPALLPPMLGSITDGGTLTVLSGETQVRGVDSVPVAGGSGLLVQLAMLTPQNLPGVGLAEGRMPAQRPADGGGPIEVVISRAAADAVGAGMGTHLELGVSPDRSNIVSSIVVVGIADALLTGDERLWEDSPGIWSPLDLIRDGAPATRFTALAAPDGISTAALFLNNPVVGRVRLRIDPAVFTSSLVSQAADETTQLTTAAQVLAGRSPALVSVRTKLPAVLAGYTVQAQAAIAQMSLMMAGVLGVAAVTLVLLSRLLVLQRSAAIALERARGASVASVGLRALLESLAVTVTGSLVGLGAVLLIVPGGLRDPFAVVAVLLVAVLAAPVQAMALARGHWTGRREPANRRDREILARRRRRQRLVIEASVLALAAASLISIRGRGLLQGRTGGIDPLLVAAPLLLAVAVTLLVIRIYPYPVRAIGSLAQRGRGVLGLLGSVRARSAIAALPLLALALGAALSVTGAMLVDTVSNGQNAAAWQRVGADARVDGELDTAERDRLVAAPGVDTVAASRSRGGVALDLGTTTATVTMIAIDRTYADVVDALPGEASAQSLRQLAQPLGDALPVVVDQVTADRLLVDTIDMYYGPSLIPLVVVGVTEFAPNGYAQGPFAYVDLDTLNTLLPESRAADRYLVMGEGAAGAVDNLTEGTVLTRTGWIDDRRSLALVAGVERVMIFAVAAVGLLAIIALLATVVGGARARGRALSMLRTLGMRQRLGWWLALAELGPLIVAAILGGIAAGIVVTVTLAPSIGLDVLTGGLTIPSTSISPGVFGALAMAGGALLGLGALADVVVHRRDKLSEVLRVGETV